MLINLSELFTCEGKKRVYQADISLPDVKFNGETYRILEVKPFELTAANTGDGKYFIEGCTTAVIELSCARCLEPVVYTCDLDLTRELVLSDSDDKGEEVLEEQPYLKGYNLDVNQLVYNELLPGLPMRVLCKEDCKGICNRCGTNLNFGNCSCDTRSLDPRMSVILDIFKE